MEALCRYPWYGNVRELENSVEFMINMMEEEGILNRQTLPDNILGTVRETKNVSVPAPPAQQIRPLKDLEEQEIRRALELFGSGTEGKRQAAKALGISLATLYRKLG